LQKIEGFKEFCEFNHLSEEVIRSAIPFMKYEKVDKGSYIIEKGETWKKFFCILRGRILVKFRNDVSEKNNNFLFYNPLSDADYSIDTHSDLNGKLEKIKEFESASKHNDKTPLRFKKTGIPNIETHIIKDDYKVKIYAENLNEKKICKRIFL
jgi:hypothetical protein